MVGLVLVWALSSCSTTGSALKELDLPLNQIQKAVATSMPFGIRRTSPNGRETFSQYFIFHHGRFKEAANLNIRAYAHAFVLGDRRPYKVEVKVITERMSEGSYSESGSDEKAAQHIIRKIRQELAKSRDDRNVIDDFKAF